MYHPPRAPRRRRDVVRVASRSLSARRLRERAASERCTTRGEIQATRCASLPSLRSVTVAGVNNVAGSRAPKPGRKPVVPAVEFRPGQPASSTRLPSAMTIKTRRHPVPKPDNRIVQIPAGAPVSTISVSNAESPTCRQTDSSVTRTPYENACPRAADTSTSAGIS